MSTVGSRLREERERFGISQIAFGAFGNVGKHSQINYENDRRNPDSKYLTSIAKHGADIMYILTGQREVDAIAKVIEETGVAAASKRIMDDTRRIEAEAAQAAVDATREYLAARRAPPAEPDVDHISAFDKPDKSEPVDPFIFKFCADIVADEYNRADVELPRNAHVLEAVWAYNKVLAQLPDPSDGEKMEAALPIVRELLRKRLADRTS